METRGSGHSNRQESHENFRKLVKLTGTGCAAYWLIDLAMSVSPISAGYRAAFSISSLPLALVEALVGGLIIACCISFFLLRFFDRIPGKHPIFKALILALGVMLLIEILSALGDPHNASRYLLLDTIMNIPRFLSLGLVIGFLYGKQNGQVSK